MSGPDPSPAGGRETGWVVRVALGYLIVMYVCACAVIAAFGYARRQEIPAVQNYFPTAQPSPSPTPHILLHPPDPSTPVLVEPFDNNQNRWSGYYLFSKVQVAGGKLLITSTRPGYGGLARIGPQSIFVPNGKYYLQADFATDVDTSRPYGMVFGFDPVEENYYLFEVLPSSGAYRLSRVNSSGLTELTPFRNTSVRPFPAANTLGVYFDHGNIELSINGSLILSTRDPAPYNWAGFGAYAESSSYTLIVDNFFAYHVR